MSRTSSVLASVVVAACLWPSMARAADYHHIHLTASSPSEAVSWYSRYLDCRPVPARTDAVDCGSGRLVFDGQLPLGGSQRSGIDHISLSYADLAATMARLESVGVGGAGVRLQRFEDGATLREADAWFLHGFIFDPWGTRIELVEDATVLGFHHVHLSSTDPAATLTWYQTAFQLERARLRDRVEGLRLGDAWLLAMSSGDRRPAPTEGRAIDHFAFTLTDIEGETARLRAAGVRFTQPPTIPPGGRSDAVRGYVAAPDNVRVAVLAPGFAGVEPLTVDAVDITTERRDYTAPRTPWGVPDVQGIWTADAAYGIPLERADDIGTDTDVLTPDQAARRRERGTLRVMWGYDSDWHDTTLGHVRSVPSRQVAIVTDPPNGRLPALTPEARARAEETRRRRGLDTLPTGPEDLSNWVRCISRGILPMPFIYNNGVQIVQGPEHVVVTTEMVHETRIIPTTATATRTGVTSYRGASRGHWEGDSLVVESTGFNGRESFGGSTANLTLTERYTRTGPDTLRYEFTLDDPTVWVRPWTGMYTLVRDDAQYELVEYACHEGNYGMVNILSGARAQEREEGS